MFTKRGNIIQMERIEGFILRVLEIAVRDTKMACELCRKEDT